MNRRNFLQSAAVATLAVMLPASVVAAASGEGDAPAARVCLYHQDRLLTSGPATGDRAEFALNGQVTVDRIDVYHGDRLYVSRMVPTIRVLAGDHLAVTVT